MNYKFDNFIQEFNGKQGVNGSREYGVSSGLINLNDYQGVFGYYCVDLSRHTKEDVDKPFSVRITGNIKSPKAMDFLCFWTVQKEVIFDIATGVIV